MDGLRRTALFLLATVEYGLAELDQAHDRVNLRRFLKAHQDVRLYYPDGEPE